jgi:hypothetical protein
MRDEFDRFYEFGHGDPNSPRWTINGLHVSFTIAKLVVLHVLCVNSVEWSLSLSCVLCVMCSVCAWCNNSGVMRLQGP